MLVKKSIQLFCFFITNINFRLFYLILTDLGVCLYESTGQPRHLKLFRNTPKIIYLYLYLQHHFHYALKRKYIAQPCALLATGIQFVPTGFSQFGRKVAVEYTWFRYAEGGLLMKAKSSKQRCPALHMINSSCLRLQGWLRLILPPNCQWKSF